MRERRFAALPDGERPDTDRVTVIVSRGTEDERTTSPLEIVRGDRLRIGATHWEKQGVQRHRGHGRRLQGSKRRGRYGARVF